MAKGIPLMGRGPDGKAKMINVDENGNVKVQLKGSEVTDRLAKGISRSEFLRMQSGTTPLTAETGNIDIINTDEAVLIERILIATNNKTLRFQLIERADDGQLGKEWGIPRGWLGNILSLTVKEIHNLWAGKFPPFELVRWDESTDEYAVMISNLRLPTGGLLRLRHNGSDYMYALVGQVLYTS